MNIFAHETGFEHVEQTGVDTTTLIVGVIVLVFVAICGVLYWDQRNKK